MTVSSPTSSREEIRILLDKINQAWLSGDAKRIMETLPECFHPDMAIRGPAFQPVVSGRDASVRSYVEFVEQAQIQSFELSEPAIDIAADTAVASYGWTMTYRLGGQEYSESGHDLFVFARIEGRWLATWRAMLPSSVVP